MGTGTFSASSRDIDGYSGIAVNVNGGSGTITYPGNLNKGSESTADITGTPTFGVAACATAA